MDRFRELSTFCQVAQYGSFSRAAKEMNTSASSVTRIVGQLEARLGICLFHRTTRRVSLTEQGQGFLSDARSVLSQLADAELNVTGTRRVPTGLLRVSAPVLFGQLHVAPLVREFLNLYPEVTADMYFVDRLVDLVDEDFDVALRVGTMPDSTLKAVRVGTIRYAMVAAPDYLKEYGTPKDLRALCDHRLIQFLGTNRSPEWVFHRNGQRIVHKISPALRVNSAQASIQAAKDGWGITRSLSYQVYDAVQSGSLAEILPDWTRTEIPVSLVRAGNRMQPAKTRDFIAFAAPRIRKLTCLNF